MNEPPDDRALVAYLARARRHSTTIDLANESLVGLEGPLAPAELATLALREAAQRGLHVMQALAASWNRDKTERQARSDQWEREIQSRYLRFRE